MPSILESLTNVLGQGGTLAKLGSLIGGDADQATEGVASAGAALLGALAENAATDEGAEPIADLVDSVGPSILDDVDGFLDDDDNEVGTGVLDALFGDDRRELLSGLSSEGSLSSSSYAELMPRLAPLVLGAVAKRKSDNNLDVKGLSTMLADERRSLEDEGNLGEWFGRTLAAGGAVAAIGGVATMAKNRMGGAADKPGDKVAAVTGRDDDDSGVKVVDDVNDRRRRRPGWFWWAVGAVILVLFLAWLLSRGSDSSEAVDQTATSVTTASTAESSNADGDVPEDPTDEELLASVEAALAAAGAEDAISASVAGGVVTLSGLAEADMDIDGLVATVGGITGIGDVVDEIAEPEAAGPSDEELLTSVEAALTGGGFAETVTATVVDGVVTLSGVAGSDADRDAVAAAAGAIDGVAEVVSDVTVEAAAAPVAAPAAGTSLNDELGLTPITFEYRSATITANGEAALAEVVAYLEANEGKVAVEGHTDDDGTVAENVALGQRRADAVVAFLETAGVDGTRLEPIGIGETEPKVANGTADGKATNRRIEFIVTS